MAKENHKDLALPLWDLPSLHAHGLHGRSTLELSSTTRALGRDSLQPGRDSRASSPPSSPRRLRQREGGLGGALSTAQRARNGQSGPIGDL